MRVQKKSSKKGLIITLAIILVTAAGVTTYALMSQNNKTSGDAKTSQTDTNSGPKDGSRPEASMDKKDGANSDAATHEKEKDITPAYEGENVNENNSLSGVINYKSVVGTNLSLRTTIDQYLSSGTCRLSLTSGTKAVTRSSAIAPNPSSSTCEGFDVPTAELGSGTWSIEIIVTSGDRTGTLKDSVTL